MEPGREPFKKGSLPPPLSLLNFSIVLNPCLRRSHFARGQGVAFFLGSRRAAEQSCSAALPYEEVGYNPLKAPTGKAESRDWVRSKVFEREGMGVGEGRENFLQKAFPPLPQSSSPPYPTIKKFFTPVKTTCAAMAARSRPGELGKHRKPVLRGCAAHVRHER